MTDQGAENIQREPTPQEELDILWKKPDAWKKGMAVEVNGLPEGMRIVEPLGEDVLILRSVVPGIPPQEEQTREPNDVPVAIFSSQGMKPEEVLATAKTLTRHISKGEVKYTPPAPQK